MTIRTMIYADVDLSDLIDIKQINRSIGNSRSISTNDAPTIGESVQYVKILSKEIEVEFSITAPEFKKMRFVDTNEPSNFEFGDINKIREQLAGIFHQREPQKLIFSDEPDRYYLAIPEGDIDLAGIQTYYDTAKITFLIPDGVAHNQNYTLIQNNQTAYLDKVVVDIHNSGTVEAFPIIEIYQPEENGYIGLVNETGVFEIGDRTEVDTETVTRSESLINLYGKDGEAWTEEKGLKSLTVETGTVDGADARGVLKFVELNGRYHLYME